MRRLLVLLTTCMAIVLLMTSCASTTRFTTTGNVRTDAVLQQANDLLGTSYCARGESPDCFDCSGFVVYCFRTAGLALPRSSRDQYQWQGGKACTKAELVPGDLVFFNTSGSDVSHVGIFVGNGKFIHAATSRGVMITPMDDPYWRAAYVGARRVLH